MNASEDNFYDGKKNELDNQSGLVHENEISLLAPITTYNPQAFTKTEEEKNSEGNFSEPEEKSSIQKFAKSEPKNDYIARLEQAKKEKKQEKDKAEKAEKTGGGAKNSAMSMREKDVSDKEDKVPMKPAQKITIMKNAMKAKDPNKIDYGVIGLDESF